MKFVYFVRTGGELTEIEPFEVREAERGKQPHLSLTTATHHAAYVHRP